jgi:hypothetical protein
MKYITIIIFLFTLVLLIPITMNNVYALEYLDEEHGFSIEYPIGWNIENEFVSQDGVDYLVTFYDNVDGWSSMLDVKHLPHTSVALVGTEQQQLNGLNLGLEQSCDLSTFEEHGFSCYNHKLIDSKVLYIDGKKSYQLTYSWTEMVEGGTMQYENISIFTSIPDGYGSWNIYSETTSEKYNFLKRQILISIDSFDILKSTYENSQISEYQSEDKIFFEDDVSTYFDFNTRPMSLITPKEFTPNWYVNSKHDFAIQFPSSWRDNWVLNESFSGNKMVEFSSKNTDAKMEFFVSDSNLFQQFNEWDKDRLYQETQTMVTESINRFPGFFHVDTLSVVKFSDGIVTGASFFQIDENGDSQLYDVTYLIFENGKIVEVLYYGDNFSAMTFYEYAIMLDSGYFGNTSIIPIVSESKLSSELFVSYDLGFSFIPPENWKELELNSEFESKQVPLTLNIITSFSPPNFQGIFPSSLFVMYADVGESTDFEDTNDEELIKNIVDGFKKGIGQTGQIEITNSDLERFEDSVKANMEGIVKVDLDGIYIERQIQMVIWIFENGEAYYLAFTADPVDYDNYISEFRNSVNTVTFKPKPQTVQVESGGCLIATATYGSELAPQVQQLRELRDNSLLTTESGTSFMNLFNDVYYSFSPVIADYERENPVFREAVKIVITPMISSLSILNYVDMDSEESVLGYGISLILLNVMMYVGIPILAVMRFRK